MVATSSTANYQCRNSSLTTALVTALAIVLTTALAIVLVTALA